MYVDDNPFNHIPDFGKMVVFIILMIILAVALSGCSLFRQTVVETQSQIEYVKRPVITSEVNRFFDVILEDSIRVEDSRVRIDLRRVQMPDSTKRLFIDATCKADTVLLELPVRTTTNTVRQVEYRVPWYVYVLAGVALVFFLLILIRR
jgi:uncharacterized membrane protein